jgi:hypothetical protein
VITAEGLSDIVVVVTLAATVALFAIMLASKSITHVERRRVLSFNPIFIILLAGVFGQPVDPPGSTTADHPGEIRRRHDFHGRRVPALPALRQRRT